METDPALQPDWRDPAAYASLLDADRSFFAWEWLRRDARYRAAAHAAFTGRAGPAAAEFGLVRFEPRDAAVPHARPVWRSDAHSPVLAVTGSTGAPEDRFQLERFRPIATLQADRGRDHLLLSDGVRALRLDAPVGTFGGGGVCLRYRIEGIEAAGPRLLTLQRFLALCREGRFARSLHAREARARRWILVLRASDALSAGAAQREIAAVLLNAAAANPRWRSEVPSLRSSAQRLVQATRFYSGGGYRTLLD